MPICNSGKKLLPFWGQRSARPAWHRCDSGDEQRFAQEAFEIAGWDRPKFWFGYERPRRSAAQRQRDFEAWLKHIFLGPKEKTKPMYLTNAITQFCSWL